MDFSTPEGKRFRRKMIVLQIVGLALFFTGVAACYQGAIRGKLWLGPAVVAAVCLLQTIVSIRGWRKEILLIAVSGIAGLVLDTALSAVGVYSAVEKTRWILPAPVCVEWILALWFNFGGKISSVLPGMRGKRIGVSVCAAVFSIIIYKRAAGLGLIGLAWGWWSLAILAVSWAIVVPLLFIFAEKLLPPLVMPVEGTQK